MLLSMKPLLFALTTATCAAAVPATIPITDPIHGTVPQRPYCPPQPVSAEFQRAAFYEIVNEFYVEQLFNQTFNDFVSDEYIQHNPFTLGGRNNGIISVNNLFHNASFTILHVIFDSPFGVIHYRWDQPGQAPTAITDIWRFNGSCVEEHWDVIQALPANATNPLALF
ncbi:MAG: hypothetical protein M1820_004617 [Bogoriella megaspora]|nr:MAG: hypothetical protein M1820_004617 [Bogoriella megaspora]